MPYWLWPQTVFGQDLRRWSGLSNQTEERSVEHGICTGPARVDVAPNSTKTPMRSMQIPLPPWLCAYINDVVTQPDFRNRGLASALMHAMHQKARDFGATCVTLTAMARARSLYAALGFEVIAEQVLFCTPDRD